MLSSMDILLNKVVKSHDYKNVEIMGSSILLKKYDKFPIGTPTTLMRIENYTYHLISFPGLCCRNYPTLVETKRDSKVLNKANIISHEVIHADVDITDKYLKENNIISNAQRYGAVTLHTDNISYIVNFIKTMFNSYRNVIKLSGRSGFKDNLSLCSLNEVFDTEIYITFVNIRSWLPVFDTRNTDCIGILINIGVEGKLTSIYDGAYIFFNNDKNILTIDGVPSYDERRRSFYVLGKKDDLGSFCDIIEMYIEKSKNKGKKMPEDKEDLFSGVGSEFRKKYCRTESIPVFVNSSTSCGYSTANTGTYTYYIS